jgi:NAD+ synthase (glutamine-hydrolysing)
MHPAGQGVTLVLRIALAQINVTVGDIKGNREKILLWAAKAKRAGADVVAFPELAVSGYPAEDLLLRREFLDDCHKSLETIAGRLTGIVAIVGFPYFSGGARNAAAVVAGGRVFRIYNKMHLPNYGVFDEKRYFVPGDKACVIRMGGARLGISICEDLWFEDIAEAQARAGAQVLVNISSSPYHAGKGIEREDLFRERAAANNVFVAYLNLVGGQDELVFDGYSMIIDPAGNIVARAKQFRDDLLVADLDWETVRRRSRARCGTTKPAVPVDTFNVGVEPRARARSIAARIETPMGKLEEIYTALLTGTRDYVRKNGFKKVVIGLSGGIDSALVAAVAVDALGKDDVVGASMPSRYSSRGSVTDARRLARNLGIRLVSVSIEDVFKSYLKSLRPVFKGLRPDVAEENIQARIRGNFLMALSNKFGWLMLNTGNKSELAMGYCTLYGDLAGGFAILKDVPKTLVYELAAYRNAQGKPVMPQAVFTKPPSAELRADQKDEDTLPPYAVLDPVLDMYVVGDMAIDDIVSAGYDRTLAKKIARLVDGNEYKRRQSPPGVKLTPKAFGKDRRMPLTNRYR